MFSHINISYNKQGYPQRMRLYRKFIWSVSLYSRLPATVNLFLSLPNHYISHEITIFKAEYLGLSHSKSFGRLYSLNL